MLFYKLSKLHDNPELSSLYVHLADDRVNLLVSLGVDREELIKELGINE